MRKLALLLFPLLISAASWAALVGQERQDSVQVVYNWTGISNSSSTILVDLSDTANFPHKDTGAIDVSHVRVDVTRLATSTGTLKIGVVKRVGDSNGDVAWFYQVDFSTDSAGPTHFTDVEDFSEGYIRCRVASGGTLPFLLTNLSTSNSAVFKNGKTIPTTFSQAGAVPARGDIVASFSGGSGSYNLTIGLNYFSEKP